MGFEKLQFNLLNENEMVEKEFEINTEKSYTFSKAFSKTRFRNDKQQT